MDHMVGQNLETEEENSSHSSDEEEVLVCEICQDILLGKGSLQMKETPF